jgi:hypothetical protein
MRNGRWWSPLIVPAKRGGNKRTVDMREVVNSTSKLRRRCSFRCFNEIASLCVVLDVSPAD